MTEWLSFDAGFFFDFAEGGLEECFAGFDFAFGEVPAAVASDEEHGAVGGGDYAASGTDPPHSTLQEAQQAERDVEGVVFIAEFHCNSSLD